MKIELEPSRSRVQRSKNIKKYTINKEIKFYLGNISIPVTFYGGNYSNRWLWACKEIGVMKIVLEPSRSRLKMG